MSAPIISAKTEGGNAAFHNFNNDFAHIVNPNERRRLALAEIDKAPFGWYHVRACVVAGIGFFTDSYDIFAVGLLTTMLGIVYWPKSKGAMPTNSQVYPDPDCCSWGFKNWELDRKLGHKGGLASSVCKAIDNDTAIKVATSAGTVVGQLGFGALADIVGRKRMYGLELIVIIFATLAQALCSNSYSINIVGIIIFWRVLMGIGIGGDYPLSSIITSEFATTKWRGAMMGAVFAMQGFGQLAAAIVMICVTVGFKESLLSAKSYATCQGVCGLAVDKMWRILIGFGAVPACIALYYRLTIPETPRYTFDVARDVEKAADDVEAYKAGKAEGNPDEIARVQGRIAGENNMTVPKASFKDFIGYFSQWKNGKVLLGTAGSWFVLDVAFYGISLNNPVILSNIGFSGGSTVYQILKNTAVGNLIIVLAGALPGYWFTVAAVDIIGRKTIQFAGFAILTVLFCIFGFGYNHISNHGLFAIYVLIQFFCNFGPNTTTFIVPGECFPTRYRSTSHGISAASGKIGAIIAQSAIAPLRVRGEKAGATGRAAAPWLDHVMQIFALFMLIGIFTTLCIPETTRKTLEELNGEEEAPVEGSALPIEAEEKA